MENYIISPPSLSKNITLWFFTWCLVLQICLVSSYSGSKSEVIPAAINRHHSVSIQKVDLPPSQYLPSTIEVKSAPPSFTIKFNSASSRLNLLHEYEPAKVPSPKTSFSEDEPHILRHAVAKPIIQEVHEIITPYRRIVQEVKPVVEDINTIVSRKSNNGLMNSEPKHAKSFHDNNVLNKVPKSNGESLKVKHQTSELKHQSVPDRNVDKENTKPSKDSPEPDLVLSENELVDNSIYNGNNELDLKYISPNSGQAQTQWLEDKYSRQVYKDR